MPSRAAAVRDLLRLGLAAVGIEPALGGVKSGHFGVLERTNGEDPTHANGKSTGPQSNKGPRTK
jgi:fructose-1,6-bisphosphatase